MQKVINGELCELVQEWTSKKELIAQMKDFFGDDFDFEYPAELPEDVIRIWMPEEFDSPHYFITGEEEEYLFEIDEQDAQYYLYEF